MIDILERLRFDLAVKLGMRLSRQTWYPQPGRGPHVRETLRQGVKVQQASDGAEVTLSLDTQLMNLTVQLYVFRCFSAVLFVSAFVFRFVPVVLSMTVDCHEIVFKIENEIVLKIE